MRGVEPSPAEPGAAPAGEIIDEPDGGVAGGNDPTRAEVDDPRDWASVLHFVLARRRREQQHVNSALSDLRQSIWAFAHSLGTELVEGQRADNYFSPRSTA
jgi:hypothetical protein